MPEAWRINGDPEIHAQDLCAAARFSIHVRPCNQPHIVFGRLGVLVADESALKHSMENKGASGSLFCVRCTNIIDHKNAVADFSNDFVLSTCVDSAQFRLHTNASTRQLLEYLEMPSRA